MINKIQAFILFVFFSSHLFANDGAYYLKGNQLIPLFETTISIKKEILTIKKVNNSTIEVTVYYEFFNPDEEKELIIGFEAFSPSGDVDGTPKNGNHPYMNDFTVSFNSSIIKHEVAIVEDSTYMKNKVINALTLKEAIATIDNTNEVNFFYVYHFKARFKKGLNTIKHTYSYTISSGVEMNYYFDYVLTAANRWGNKQIDDFTLILDLGEFESCLIEPSFFKNENEWIINGLGKSNWISKEENGYMETEAVQFHLQKGTLIFQKLNFKPSGELVVFSRNEYSNENLNSLPFSYYRQEQIPTPDSDLEMKIMRNLPFARRGYVFTNKELAAFYSTLKWYLPNPNYVADVKSLTDLEKEWLEKIK